jgi:hypothetical protein
VWLVVESWFVVVPCGPLWVVRVSSLDRDFEPVGKRCVCPSRSWVYPTRGRGAEHNSFPCILLSLWCHDRGLLPTSLGCGHHGLHVIIDVVLIRTIRAL